MSPTKHCAMCGAELPHGVTPCPRCGCAAGTVVTPGPGEVRAQTYAPTKIQAGSDPATGDSMIMVDDPSGVRSEARRTAAGTVSLVVEGAANVGRGGEARLAETLRSKLQELGLKVSITSGADHRGEDALMHLGADTLVLQMATTPSAPAFWREARRGSAVKQVEAQRAVQWLRTTIDDKALAIPPTQRTNTVLAVDARHAGVLATSPVLDEYMRQFGGPAEEYGFASVWVVGPTTPYCARIGKGVP